MSEAVVERPLLESSAYGKLAELRAIDELIRRGHKVATPVVDDDGVDLVVDYRVTVQVKNSYRRLMETAPGYTYEAYSWGNGKSGHFAADVHMLLAGEDWWIVPGDFLRPRCRGQINMYLSSTRGFSFELQQFKDAWHVFDR